MEGHGSYESDSLVSMAEGTNSTSSDEESSTQFCSLTSEAGRNIRSFQRHQSVDEWLQGISVSLTPSKVNSDQQMDGSDNDIEDGISVKLNPEEMNGCEEFFQFYDIQKSGIEESANSDVNNVDSDEISETSSFSLQKSDDDVKNNLKTKSEIYKDTLELEDKEIWISDKGLDSSETPEENIKNEQTNNFHGVRKHGMNQGNISPHQRFLENNQENNTSSDDQATLNLYVLNYEKEIIELMRDELDQNELDSNKEQHVSVNNLGTGICFKNNFGSRNIELMSCQRFEDNESKTLVIAETDPPTKKESDIANDVLHFLDKNNEGFDKVIRRSFENLACDKEKHLKAKYNERSSNNMDDARTESGIFSITDAETERPVMQRSKSLKTCRTPPGNPSCPKLVRFADILGLDLFQTRVFADEIPKVPKQAFEDLNSENIDSYWANAKPSPLLPRNLIPRPAQLIPIFPQPGTLLQFPDLVRNQKICLENAWMTGLTTLTGNVRLLNISFSKSVTVIWTMDHWVTKLDTTCQYVTGGSDGITDKFRFHLETAGLAVGSRLHMCLRYETSEQEFWDNNGGGNYVFRVAETGEGQQEFLGDFLS